MILSLAIYTETSNVLLIIKLQIKRALRERRPPRVGLILFLIGLMKFFFILL